jgi:hypothetical protein
MSKCETFVPIIVALLFMLCLGFKVGDVYGAFSNVPRPSRLATLGLVTSVPASVYISDHETLAIENRTYELTNEIIANESAVILVRNATLVLSPPEGIEPNILLKGSARLIILDSNVTFNRTADYCNIEAEGQTQINLTDSELAGKGLIIGRNDSEIFASRVQFRSNSPIDRPSGFAMFGNSSLEICNSSFDGAYVWENARASIDESEVNIIRTGFDQSTHTLIGANNSQIVSIETLSGQADFSVNNSYLEVGDFNGNIFAWFENSTVGAIYGSGNVSAWLDNSHVRYVSIEQGATVLVAVYLPILGLIGIPYQLTGFLLVASVLVVIGGIVAVSYAVYQKTRRRGKPVHI